MELPRKLHQSNYEKGSKMTVWSVLGLVVLGGIAVVAVLAVLFDRARKAIELLKFDAERL